jgi:hypothetical protein
MSDTGPALLIHHCKGTTSLSAVGQITFMYSNGLSSFAFNFLAGLLVLSYFPFTKTKSPG